MKLTPWVEQEYDSCLFPIFNSFLKHQLNGKLVVFYGLFRHLNTHHRFNTTEIECECDFEHLSWTKSKPIKIAIDPKQKILIVSNVV